MTTDAPELIDGGDDDNPVFRKAPPRAWALSFAAHAGAFALLAMLGTYVGVRTGVIPPSIIEFDAPPRRPPPATPAPPRPTTPAPSTEPQRAARPAAAARPSGRPGRGRSNAPHVMATQGNGGSGGDEMPVGDNNDFRGGVVGNGGGEAPAVTPVPAPVEAPAPTVDHRNDVEVAEENLSVRAVVECDDAALAGLYPQQALDNEVEVSSLSVEMVVDADGRLSHPRARSSPGFGIAAAMEQGALAHCRVVTVPRDSHGRAVRTRVVKRIRFMFE